MLWLKEGKPKQRKDSFIIGRREGGKWGR